MGDQKTPVIPQLGGDYTTAVASVSERSYTSSKSNYRRKYKNLKRFAKDLIYQNAAICDEIEQVEKQFVTTQDETRCLLQRLLQFEQSGDADVATVTLKADQGTSQGATPVKSKVKRKVPAAKTDIQTSTDPAVAIKPKVKRTKGGAIKKTVPAIPLDEFGRPLLPLEMGELTVHSLGEIVYDKASFHCPESIYPVGFCSTRVYASSYDPYTRCLYTCKISDVDSKPLFEISPEENPDDIRSGDSPTQCLSALVRSISLGTLDLRPTHTDSLAFFGLTHPVVHNLIQSCPGSKKCSSYRWVKFEINKELAPELVQTDENTPTVSYQSLLDTLKSAAP